MESSLAAHLIASENVLGGRFVGGGLELFIFCDGAGGLDYVSDIRETLKSQGIPASALKETGYSSFAELTTDFQSMLPPEAYDEDAGGPELYAHSVTKVNISGLAYDRAVAQWLSDLNKRNQGTSPKKATADNTCGVSELLDAMARVEAARMGH